MRIPVNRSPIPAETDHPFRPKPITHSGRNRSPVRSEATRDPNHQSRFSRFVSPPVSGVIAWDLPSCRVVDIVFVSTGTERPEGSARGGRGRPGCSSGFDEERRWVVGAVGNRVLCGFPSSYGRGLCVHGAAASTAPVTGAGSGPTVAEATQGLAVTSEAPGQIDSLQYRQVQFADLLEQRHGRGPARDAGNASRHAWYWSCNARSACTASFHCWGRDLRSAGRRYRTRDSPAFRRSR